MSGSVLFEVENLQLVRAAGRRRFELVVPALTVRRGERLALVGRSGCGKSTLLDLLALILLPSAVGRFRFAPGGEGAVDLVPLFGGRRLEALAELRGHHIGYVLQTGGLLSFLSVAENIALGLAWQGGRDRRGRAEQLARRLGIHDQLDKKPEQLSAGERQRVAIARALAHRPGVILADEPTAALDPDNAERVMGAFVEAVQQLGTTLIVASHDRALVERFGLARIEPALAAVAGGVRSTFVH